jgi:hypothetical protein
MLKSTRMKRLARHLLATTCLTAGAAALANAQVVTEGIGGAPADFGNTFGAAYLLPDGTTQVNGTVEIGSDPADFFTFQGLQGGTGFSFTATSTLTRTIGLDIFNSSDSQLGATDFFSSAEAGSGIGTVPSDGTLTFELFPNGSGEGLRTYSVNLTATSTPEPGTLGAMGLGLTAGAAALARRRRKKI